MAKDPLIDQKHPREQWKKLLFEPLSKLKSSSPQPPVLVFVIDALDECEDQDAKLILQCLAEAKDLNTVRLQIFVTSRPNPDIFSGVSGDAYQDVSLHRDIDEEISRRDILTFLDDRLEAIRKDRTSQEDPPLLPDWPGKEGRDALIQKADKLFIYAETACRFLRKSPSGYLEDCLSIVLNDSNEGSGGSHLHQLYTSILDSWLDRIPGEIKEKMKQEFKKIVGSIVILFDPLSVTALAKLLGMSEIKVENLLKPLFAVLFAQKDEQARIELLHPSFRDFLLDREKCRNDQFWIDKVEAHKSLAECCLERLKSNTLKRDICKLQRPGTVRSEVEESRVESCLPIDVQYACRYWVEHLHSSEQVHAGLCDDGLIHSILRKHFLHWLEALSLIGRISEGVLVIELLRSMLTVGDPTLVI
jgi:hypothetical protein